MDLRWRNPEGLIVSKASASEAFDIQLVFLEITVEIDNVVWEGLAVIESTTINGMTFFAQDSGLGSHDSAEY